MVTLTVHAVTMLGESVSGVNIIVSKNGGFLQPSYEVTRTPTNERGLAVIEVPAGKYAVTAEDTWYLSETRKIALEEVKDVKIDPLRLVRKVAIVGGVVVLGVAIGLVMVS